MSKRGDMEKHCLNIVKDHIKESVFFAISSKDCKEITSFILNAKENDKPSEFPDFIFEGGFIEHFEVTSSHSNRNGSTIKHEKYQLKKEAEAKEKAFMEEMNETPCYEGKLIKTDTWFSKHTYDDFCLSFKRAWENHIDSLKKYDGDKSNSFFMFQYSDSALRTKTLYTNIKQGLRYGDLLKDDRDYIGYRITRDTNLLDYIYSFNGVIKYVIFVNEDRFLGDKIEIVSVENIPEIIKIVKGRFDFSCAMIGASHNTYGISHKNPFYKGNGDNE